MNQLRNLQTAYPSSTANGDPTHEYIDAMITNNTISNGTNSTGPIDPIPVIFNQIKTSNIIDDCSKYYLSVIRWSVETSLPIIIPTIQLGNNPTSLASGDTDYYVSLLYNFNLGNGGFPSAHDYYNHPPNDENAYFYGGRQLALTPSFVTDATINQPLNPQTLKDYMNNPYFHMDSVQSFLDILNGACESLFAELLTVITGLASKGEEAPLFVWNSATNKIELTVSLAYVPHSITDYTSKIFIGMSTSLYNLFNTFNTRRINSNPAYTTYGGDYVFNLGLTNNISASRVITSANYTYTYPQESSSVPSWSPVSSIVFVTNSIPVNATHSGLPQFQGSQIGSSLNQNATSTILTDFEIPMETGVEYRNISYYSPNSEYRLFDLVSNQQLNSLNVQIFWRDKYGELHPLLLRQNASASIKLLLRKKDFNGV